MKSELKESIEKCVLCWLATSTPSGEPNVSPKEAFTHYGDDSIIIANIASPNTVKNIEQNANVCISFIDVFVQKGFQVKGTAQIVKKDASDYSEMKSSLLTLVGEKFPFDSITQIHIEHTKPIIAPSYFIYPETTEQQQIESAYQTYGLTVKK